MFIQRNQNDYLIIQQISELIWELIQEYSEFLFEFKKEILEIFENDEFFDCNIQTLMIWSKIIDRYLEELKPNLIENYIEQVNFSSLFRSKKQKVFKEFVLFFILGKLKSEREKYIKPQKLKIFLEKIKEVLKDESIHPNLIIMIFFSLRILILRLRNETLNTLFKSMWPSILFLLEKMIRSSKWDKTKNHEIVIAAMKLLELISFTDIEEFNLHRWAFLFEYFGIKIIQNKQNLNQNIESPFIINPALICKIPQGTKISYQGEKSNKILKSSKRKILLIRNQLHSERMEEKIVEFLNYWILLSTTEMKINQKDMESLIQGDFIDFKNFINL